uniref:Carbonic anhydrase n=1 Tax=Parascaris univalens TaxID=6257 RepID=A0A915B4L5_PARUN
MTRIRDFPDLIFNHYDVLGTVIAGNNGDTGILAEIVQGFTSWTRQPTISGGGLNGSYKLQQFHFHWDKISNTGSEHAINKLHYALEVHFVHIREDLTFEEAQNTPNGIAVLAIFFAIDNRQSQLKSFEELFNLTMEVGSQSVVSCRPSDFLPMNRDVWFRYTGSLTTPPCSETVIWTIFAEPIYVDESQVCYAEIDTQFSQRSLERGSQR